MPQPKVAVILAVLNEVDFIDACLESLTAQDYTGPFEIVVADGGSDDGTLDWLKEWADRGVTTIHNPDRVQSYGLNAAADATDAEILVRADGHTAYQLDYLSRSVEALEGSGAIAAGGLMTPQGDSRFTRAVAAAMTSPLAIGPGKFHHSTEAGPVDTVYLGAFRRTDFLNAGGFRALPSGVAEDADLYFRWRQQGETVWLDPSIRSTYRPRRGFGALWRQYFRWGRGKADMFHANGKFPSWRPLAPLALILGLDVSVVLAIYGFWWPLAVIGGAWLAVLILAALSTFNALVAPITAVMHSAYGVGMAVGLVRRRSTNPKRD